MWAIAWPCGALSRYRSRWIWDGQSPPWAVTVTSRQVQGAGLRDEPWEIQPDLMGLGTLGGWAGAGGLAWRPPRTSSPAGSGPRSRTPGGQEATVLRKGAGGGRRQEDGRVFSRAPRTWERAAASAVRGLGTEAGPVGTGRTRCSHGHAGCILELHPPGPRATPWRDSKQMTTTTMAVATAVHTHVERNMPR